MNVQTPRTPMGPQTWDVVRNKLDQSLPFANMRDTPYYRDCVWDQFSEAEYKRRYAALRAKMKEHKLDAVIARNRGRKGIKPLTALMAGYRGAPDTRSRNERRFLALVRAAGLPEPSMNVVVEGIVVDFLWPEHKLVLEVDSYLYHHTPKDRAEDRRKQRILEQTGHTVLRVTDDELKHDPAKAVHHVAVLRIVGQRVEELRQYLVVLLALGLGGGRGQHQRVGLKCPFCEGMEEIGLAGAHWSAHDQDSAAPFIALPEHRLQGIYTAFTLEYRRHDSPKSVTWQLKLIRLRETSREGGKSKLTFPLCHN